MKHLWRKAALAGLLAPALVVGVAHTAAAAVGPSAITDPAGDTYNDDDDIIAAPSADIVSSDARRTGDTLTLSYATARPLDPEKDPAWDSEETYTDFFLDTNGDGKDDFNVEYGVDDDGDLYVDVYKVTGADNPPLACEGVGTFAGGVHTAVVPLSCLGDAKRLDYRVEVNYDLDVNTAGKVAYDDAPDSGFAPVA